MTKDASSADQEPMVRFEIRTDRKRKGALDAQLRSRSWREFIESVAIAIVLAFLFRAFEAEAFVIPTGSMAPTLQGRHKDVECEKCGHWYQAGASAERNSLDNSPKGEFVVGTVCPVCRWPMTLDVYRKPNHRSFSGDRILVSKFSYELSEPERWDVIVFKYPNDLRMNYIKRLVGLPNERIMIWRGDIYVQKPGDDKFRIARKPPRKLAGMLQLVDDSEHIPAEMKRHWPLRWQPWSPGGASEGELAGAWSTPDEGHSYALDGKAGEVWLRYHHLVPSYSDWALLSQGKAPPDLDRRRGQLISDFYTYNVFDTIPQTTFPPLPDPPPGLYNPDRRRPEEPRLTELGMHWVPDLALEAEVEVQSDQGDVVFNLVKGGDYFECRIDVQTGVAKLSIRGEGVRFRDPQGAESDQAAGQTSIRGRGAYTVRYTNVDDELTLWVGGKRVEFDGPTTYAAASDVEMAAYGPEPIDGAPVLAGVKQDLRPRWSPQDPGDLAPLAVGVQDAQARFSKLRVLRDVYYIAISTFSPLHGMYSADYEENLSPEQVLDVLSTPETWETTSLFPSRRWVLFKMGDDQFFPLGDNSPQSKDARVWLDRPGDEPHVGRELLVGKALFIYWPHPWYAPIPYMPNFSRMQLIR